MLHQTIILGFGWFVIPLEMGMLPKYFIITTISFALTMGIYDLLIRRVNFIRFLFGMRVF